jgi:hypothetical protein
VGSIQKVHGQTAEAQILVGADWVGDVSVGRVAFFISESINCHGKKLHAILEIIVYMWVYSTRMRLLQDACFFSLVLRRI